MKRPGLEYQISFAGRTDTFVQIFGVEALNFTELQQRLWDYVTEHGLIVDGPTDDEYTDVEIEKFAAQG